jgi:excisionase family DNA binding protein
MNILTVDEAAAMLRVTKRTLYRLREIPRVRIGHRIMYLEEDLETWVKAQREGIAKQSSHLANIAQTNETVYHRNPLFMLQRKS